MKMITNFIKRSDSTSKLVIAEETVVEAFSAESEPEKSGPEVDLEPEVKAPTTGLVPIYNARRFYPGDIVIKKLVPKSWEWSPCFGTVMKPPVGSDMSNSYDQGSSTDFHVHWETTNRVENTKEQNVNLADRLLLRNMRVESEDGSIGTVSSVKVLTTVQIVGTNHVVDKVAIERLRPITSIIRGQEVLYRDWVGVITCVRRNIWFLLDGGMGFYVNASETDGFMRNDPYWGVGVACPGIRTKLSASVMKTATWTSGPMKFFSKWIPPLSYLYSMAHSTIDKSEVTEIEVRWLQLAPECEDSDLPKPPDTLKREDLKYVRVIGIPSSETVGINSVRMLKLRPEDSLTTYDLWLEAFKKKYIQQDETASPPRTPAIENAPLRVLATERVYEIPVKVLHRQSIVDITYGDGSVQRVHSIKLSRIIPTKEDNEFPQGMVVAPLYKLLIDGEVYGVVLESDALAKGKKRKVNVKWISKGGVIETTQECIFNIRPHEKYSLYQRGTIVFPRTPGSTRFQAAVVSDLNIAAGKMVVVVTGDNSQQEVYPHTVSPLPQRCFWNFFNKNWVVDEIIPPPYQLECEFHPIKKFPTMAETTADILSNNNNADGSAPAGLWDEPSFELLGFAPESHRYINSNPGGFGKNFISAVEKEISAMKGLYAIPDGIWIRSYENRLDLVSVLMVGPKNTPFEEGLFMFDMQLPSDFPSSPPKVHYVSYSFEITPVMSWDGNFCISGLDWDFKDSSPVSYIVNCVSQIQGMVFAMEPYFSDSRKVNDKETARGKEISRMYNETSFLRVIDSIWNMIHRPHDPWAELIKSHYATVLPERIFTMENWKLDDSSEESTTDVDDKLKPPFPLAPVSEGFRDSFLLRIEKFKKITQTYVPPQQSARSSRVNETVKDATADSESVLDSAREMDITVELVEPVSSVNANVVAESKPQTPQTEPGQTESPTDLDSQKNVIKLKRRGGKKSGRKGKILKGIHSASESEAESETSVNPEDKDKETREKMEKVPEEELTAE